MKVVQDIPQTLQVPLHLCRICGLEKQYPLKSLQFFAESWHGPKC